VGWVAEKEEVAMKRFLIPATLILTILLTALGCGNSGNILAPESDTGNDVTLSSNDETDVWSEVDVPAAPKKEKDKSGDVESSTQSSKVTKKEAPSSYYYRRR